MTRVLITGASGFTGKVLAQRLEEEADLKIFPVSRAHIDLSFAPDVARLINETKPAWIFHLAGRLKGSAPELFQDNLLNTVYLLEAAAKHAPQARVLLIGSAAEYGSVPDQHGPVAENYPCAPAGPYGISKYAATLTGLEFSGRTSLQINIARAFNLIGPEMPGTLLLGALIQRAREAVKAGRTVIQVGEVSAERDFIDVRDAVEAYIAIMKSSANREIFNICSGASTPVKALVDATLRHFPQLNGYAVDPALAGAGAKRVVGNPEKIRSLGFVPRFGLADSLAAAFAK